MSIGFRLLLASLAVCGSLIAQPQKKNLTIEDAVLRQRSTLAPKRLPGLQWGHAGDAFSYTESAGGDEWLMEGRPGNKTRTRLFSLSNLNGLLRTAGSDTLAKWPAVIWKGSASFHFEAGGRTRMLDVSSNSLTVVPTPELPKGAEHIEPSKGGPVAFVQDYNIMITAIGEAVRQVTKDGSRELLYGTSVHRDEFGINKGLFWSPDNRRLAFYRMDQSMVTDYPLLDFAAKPANHEPIKYPFAGDSSHQVSIGVYDMSSGSTIYLQTGLPTDQYLTNIAWSPDAQSVYVAVLNRGQDHMKLNRYSAKTGAFETTLFEERDPMYTEPMHPIEFLPGDPTKFIWQSRRDGWNHLYLYDISGKPIRQVTKGEWEITDFNGFDSKGKTAFFHSTDNMGLDRVFKSVELSSGKVRLLSSGSGVHTCVLNSQRTAFIDNWSSQVVPRIIRIASTRDGKVLETLLEAANPLADYTVGQTRTFTISAADGKTPLWCRLILPADFDSTRKYPAVVYLYGGPHAQMITNTWLAGADLWFHYLTQQGYIVFTVDNRGSSNRGKTFEQATFRKLGEEEMRDQIAGVNALKAFRYVDASRLGVYGWSFGGFMTTSLMTRYPGVFKAAVAGGPVMDWNYYEVMYTERYMDMPSENPEGYRISKLTAQADQLNGKLLLIHGTSDDVVVWQHSLMFLKQAVSKGVQLDYFVYPGHLHNVTGKDRVHLNSKITGYFNDFLK